LPYSIWKLSVLKTFLGRYSLKRNRFEALGLKISLAATMPFNMCDSWALDMHQQFETMEESITVKLTHPQCPYKEAGAWTSTSNIPSPKDSIFNIPVDNDDYPFLAHLSSRSGIINISFNVYKAGYVFGPVRNHYALFVETDDDKKGYFIHVFGDVQEGMDHIQGQTKPEYRHGYLGKELLGTVAWTRFGDLLDVCESMPLPWK